MPSSQPRKQRLARLTAPHHTARKQMASHLSEELLLKYNRRNLTVILGDEVRVMRGDHRGKTGKVVEINATDRKVNVEGVTNKKADGTEVPLPVDPSNLVLIRLNLEDAHRRNRLGETEEAAKKGEAGTPKEHAAKRPSRSASGASATGKSGSAEGGKASDRKPELKARKAPEQEES
jgi:large subunit ribosomal protein L24